MFLDFAGPYYILRNKTEKRSWRFEMHNFCGPIRLEWSAEKKDFEPSDETWKEGSAFWNYFQMWIDGGQEHDGVDVNGFRLCKY